MNPPQNRAGAPGQECAHNSAETADKVSVQLPVVNPEVADELLRAALKRTQDFIQWQKRKQAEARGKTIIVEGGATNEHR